MQEIERKYLPTSLPDHLESFPHREIVQGYLSRSPAIRVRASRGHYRLTVKGGGMMMQGTPSMAHFCVIGSTFSVSCELPSLVHSW